MSFEKIKPALILAAIAAIVSALCIITYNVTYVDTSGILTEKQAAAVVSIYGGAAEDYSVVPAEQWSALFEADEQLSRVTKVIKKNDGSLAFEVVVKGYKEGFDLLVGVKDGAVAGVAVVSTGEETKDLGTKAAEPEYLEQFKGISDKAAIVKNDPKNEGEVRAVTGATYSSKGVASAVNIALSAYDMMQAAQPVSTTGGEIG
ncbi:MAG: FMN-binding protein [Ruminococcaceae bacterium]|nr:FMN-binding protein [Oscillospiraceae bacterium]